MNIGPDRHGNIPEPAVKTLQDVGDWMKIYGETVYGTEKNSLMHPFEYGYVTQKTENDGSVHWYLHVSPSCWEEKEILLNGIAGSLIEFTVFLEAGEYDLDAEYAAWYQGGELYFIIDDQKNDTATYENTGNPSVENDINNYISTNLIKGINIPVSKFYSIKIHRNAQLPNVTNWINVRSFTLIKTSQNGNTDTPVYPIFIKNGYLVCKSPVDQTVKIFDAGGRLRKTCTVGINKIVNVRTFEPGVYVIKGNNFTQKIILQ